jgi:hypothetical protein
VFVFEARPARTSLIPTDLGAKLPLTNDHLRRHLDPLLADLELRFLMPESFGPSPEAFLSRPDIVLPGGNQPLAGGKLFCGLVRHNGNPLAFAIASAFTISCSMSATMARPIEISAASQYRFHVDHCASVTGTLTIRNVSS